MKLHERRLYPLGDVEVRQGDGALHYEGLAAVFEQLSEPLFGFREIVRHGAFAKTLAESPDVRFLVNHEGVPMARTKSGTLALEERTEGLWSEAPSLDPANPTVVEMASALRRGDIDQMSFAFWTIRDEFRSEGDEIIRTLLELSLDDGDVSVVTYPAYKGTSGELRKAVRELLIARGMLTSLRRAIAPHSSPTSEEAWDGPAHEARLPNDAGAETYRRAYAWVDSEGDPDTKAAYRFIHHEVDSGGSVGAANVQANLSAIGVLNGGRGGTTIPDEDRPGVYDHLAKHLRDADLEPPELREPEGDGSRGLDPITFAGLLGEVREGKVLSAKNRDLVVAAIDALSSLLEAAEPEPKSLEAYRLEVEFLERALTA